MDFKFNVASDIQEKVNRIISSLDLFHIDGERVICMRSKGSKSKAFARIWNLPRVWQKALKVDAHYVIEVLSERYDRASEEEQDKVLIHELLHIPKTFSGALVPHKCFGKKIDRKRVDKLYKKYKSSN